MKKFILFVFILFLLVLPAVSSAQTDTDIPDQDFLAGKSLVPCGQADAAGVISNPCSFKDIMTLINKVINFVFKFLAVPIAAIMFVYAGFLLITAGEEAAGARTKARSIFTNAVIGLALAAGAWLIVKTILSILSSPRTWTWIGF